MPLAVFQVIHSFFFYYDNSLKTNIDGNLRFFCVNTDDNNNNKSISQPSLNNFCLVSFNRGLIVSPDKKDKTF